MRRFVYGMAIGVVAVAAAVAFRAGANRAPAVQEMQGADDPAVAAAVEHARVRSDLAAALIRGELTVPQAVARFQDLLTDDPVALRALSARYPGASVEGLAAIQAVGFVEHSPVGDPGRRADLTRQLEAMAQATRKRPALMHTVIGSR